MNICECNVTNCEFNENEECLYCGDYWTLNNKEKCIAFEEKEELGTEEQEYLLISEEEREELRKAYKIIEGVKNKLNIDYEEFFAIDTTLQYLNNAINYEKKFLS